MKKYLLAILLIALAFVAGYYATRSTDITFDEPERVTASKELERKQLLDRYRTALIDANVVIEDMNIDIATAQQIEQLEELEGYIDAVPLRDTIAHPQP